MSNSFLTADKGTHRRVMLVGLMFCAAFVAFSFFAREQPANTYVPEGRQAGPHRRLTAAGELGVRVRSARRRAGPALPRRQLADQPRHDLRRIGWRMVRTRRHPGGLQDFRGSLFRTRSGGLVQLLHSPFGDQSCTGVVAGFDES